VPGYLSAVLAWPQAAGARPLPVAVAVHGSYDQPEWNCQTYQQVVHGAAIVVCPRGKLRWDTPEEASLRRFYFPAAGSGATASAWLKREVSAALRALQVGFPTRVAAGPVLYIGFSQGAILGAPLVIADPARFPRAILVEGGHGAWNADTAAAFARGGGQRVLFACGRASCMASARAAAAQLDKAGVAARVVYAPDQGHTYADKVQEQVAAAFDWIVAGDTRFATSPVSATSSSSGK
jgi:predicted esterase